MSPPAAADSAGGKQRGAPRVDVYLGPAEVAAALREDVRAGLGSAPRELPAKWLYDRRGCELFEQITRLPEYYPTRREREILEREAGEVAGLSGADTLVELGSGTSEKTRLLLDAMAAGGRLRRFVALDVAEPAVTASTAALAAEYPGVEVHGLVGDFDHHLDRIPGGGRRLVAFLGGTIGNLRPHQRKRFLADVSAQLTTGDALLLGTDLVKGPDRLVAAYDDSAGVTAAFNRNVLSVLNRELGADFEVGRYEHVARWDADDEWVEMALRCRGGQRVSIPEVAMSLDLVDGELVRTEISAKFRREVVEAEVNGAGLDLTRWWTDAAGDFALSLCFA